MAEELKELWRKLSFMEEEDEGIVLGNNSTKAAKARGRLCAVLKILTHKSVHVDALKKKPKNALEIEQRGQHKRAGR